MTKINSHMKGIENLLSEMRHFPKTWNKRKKNTQN